MDPRLAPPVAYDAALAALVCRAIVRGTRLDKAHEIEGLPTEQTIADWYHDNDAFKAEVARAQASRCEFDADKILDIADAMSAAEVSRPPTPSEVNTQARAQIAARQWLLSTRNPEKYGRVSAGASRKQEKADKAEAAQAAADRDALHEERFKAAMATTELVDITAFRAKQAGTHTTENIEVDGCLIPLDRYVAPGGIFDNNAALTRDRNPRILVARLSCGIVPEPGAFDPDMIEPDLLAALTRVRKEGDPPVLLKRGPLPGAEHRIGQPAWKPNQHHKTSSIIEYEGTWEGEYNPAPENVDDAVSPEPEAEAPGIPMARRPVSDLSEWAGPRRQPPAERGVFTDYDIHADIRDWDDPP